MRSVVPVLLASVLVSWMAASPALADPREGDVLKSFAGYALSGQMTTWSGMLKGAGAPGRRVVVVSTYGTWCESCQVGLPRLDKVLGRVKDVNVGAVVIGVGDTAEKLDGALQKMGVKSSVLVAIPDPHLKIAQRNDLAEKLPRTLVVDDKGVIRKMFTDEKDPKFEADLEAAIRAAAR